MKKALTAACAAIMLASCAGVGSRPATEEASTATTAEPETEMVCGGYTQQRDLLPEELELFKTVTAELDGVRYTPESVATQVVAGTNYRFICKAVTATREPQTYQAAVVVYQPLPSQEATPRITSIEKL